MDITGRNQRERDHAAVPEPMRMPSSPHAKEDAKEAQNVNRLIGCGFPRVRPGLGRVPL